MLGNSSFHSMFLLHLEFLQSYVPLNQILRVNWSRTMCIFLINSHKLSETRSNCVHSHYFGRFFFQQTWISPLGSRLWCLTVSLSLSHWYPGSGMVLDCIDSLSLHPYLLCIGLNFSPYIDSVVFSYSGPSGIFSFSRKLKTF